MRIVSENFSSLLLHRQPPRAGLARLRPPRALVRPWASVSVRRGVLVLLLALLTLLFLSLVVTSSAAADVIYLKNGNKIRGKVINEDPKGYLLEVPYGTMRVLRRQVAKIERESDETYLRRTGEDLIEFRAHDTGIEYLERALKEKPDSDEIRLALHRALVSQADTELDDRQLDLARKHLDRAAKLSPDSAGLTRAREKWEKLHAEFSRLESEALTAHQVGDHEAAYAHFEKLLERYPVRREEWRPLIARSGIALGNEAMVAREFAAARGFYHAALLQEPDRIAQLRMPLVYAEVNSAVPWLRSGEFRKARAQLEAAHDLLPDEPAVIFHLALACEGSNDLQRAADLYRKLAGPENRPINGERHLEELRLAAEERLAQTSSAPRDPRWSEMEGTKGTLSTKEFVIHYRHVEQGREVRRYLEHHFRRLKKRWFAGMNPPRLRQPIEVILHPNREAMRERTDSPTWSPGFARNYQRYGLVTKQELHFDASDPQFLTSVLPHELAHALLPYRIGSAANVPTWLDEGIATFEEPKIKQDYYARLTRDSLASGKLIPLGELFKLAGYPSETQAINAFYAQCNSVIRFLQEQVGTRALFTTLIHFLDTEPDEALARSTRFDTVGELEQRWKAWVRGS